MHTQKIAITMPTDLVLMIDDISKKRGLSRSRYISIALQEKMDAEKKIRLKNAYDKVFSDETVCKEQLETSRWLEGGEVDEGQEW